MTKSRSTSRRQRSCERARNLAGWIVKRLGGRSFRRRIALLSLSAFITCSAFVLYLTLRPPAELPTSVWGQITIGMLTNLWAASLVSLIGLAFWYLRSKYRESECTIHTFTYNIAPKVGRRRTQLALQIADGLKEQVADPGFSCKAIEAEDDTTLRTAAAEQFLAHKTGHIAIVPFMEIAKTIGAIFQYPSGVPVAGWKEKHSSIVESLFTLFVTYDPELENRVTRVQNLRLFSTPLIDVPAMFNHMNDNPRTTHIVLLGEADGEFQQVEGELRKFVHSKVHSYRQLANFKRKYVGEIVDAGGQYAPQQQQQIAVFVMTVDPSEGILNRVKGILEQVADVGGSVNGIYVPPTWLRNWSVAEDNQKTLLYHWDEWLSGRKLTTALPEGVGVNGANWVEDGPAFDIILFYTRLAVDIVKAVLKEIQREEGVPYDKVARALDQKVKAVLRARQHDSCFLATFEHGDLFYEPVIVNFGPNRKKLNFVVE